MSLKDSELCHSPAVPDFPALLEEFIGDRQIEEAAVKLRRSSSCVRYWRKGTTCPHPNDAEDLADRMGRSVKLVRASILQTRKKRAVAP